MANSKKIIVIYHGDCPDGFSGAWVAWKRFGNKAKYIGAKDRMNPPDGLAGKTVYFIDWTYHLPTMEAIMRKAKKVIAIDHHETNEDSTKAVPDHVYDLSHSAAVLAWKYFYPEKVVPKFLEYVEDYDIWKHAYQDTDAVNACLGSIDFTFKNWGKLVLDFEKNATRRPYIVRGRSILSYQDKMVNEIANNAEQVEFFGHRVLAVNCPVLQDQLGNLLAKRKPPFGIVWRVERGKLRVSFRSRNNFDIARYAEKFGGGGHKTAAGFSILRRNSFPWKWLRK